MEELAADGEEMGADGGETGEAEEMTQVLFLRPCSDKVLAWSVRNLSTVSTFRQPRCARALAFLQQRIQA